MATARLLIVEDERLTAIDLQRRLTRLGYTVVSLAASGIEAIQSALEQVLSGRPPDTP